MKINKPTLALTLATGATGFALLMPVGCANSSDAPPAMQSAQTANQSPGAPGKGQLTFDSDDQASQAMLDAVKAQDHEKVHQILGPAWKELISGDPVEDNNAFKAFADRAAAGSHLQKIDAEHSILDTGKDDSPFPVPIVRSTDGKWFFDTEAGKGEILARRVGRNELDAIDVCRTYVQAQREYFSKPRDTSGDHKYAQRIISSPGRTDGLYWPVKPGQEQSPLSVLTAEASSEGYTQHKGQEAYRGYRYHILKKQGASAPGGQRDYILTGDMTGGFALVAYPELYGSSGIMTFIVGEQGTVYQRDLGPDTVNIARKMTEFNPDAGWSEVK